MFTVIGFERVDYVSKKTGNPVKGVRVYATEPREKITGVSCMEFFLSDFKSNYLPQLGDNIEVYYNRFGQIENIKSVK